MTEQRKIQIIFWTTIILFVGAMIWQSNPAGTASKSAVKKMVNRLLDATLTNDHEADATAAAIAGLLEYQSFIPP